MEFYLGLFRLVSGTEGERRPIARQLDEVEKMAAVATVLAYLHMDETKECDAVRQGKTLQWHQFVF